MIARVNRARHEHPALQSDERLWFHSLENEQLIAYTKNTADRSDIILTVVNLDFFRAQAGTLELGLEGLGLPADAPYELVDLLDDAVYLWQGPRNWIELDPAVRQAHLFQVRPRLRTERDFEQYL